MLIKNGQRVKLEEDKDFQRFKKHIIPSLPDPVRFRHVRRERINPTGLREPAPAFNLVYSALVEGDNGLEEWAYAERTKFREGHADYLIPQKHADIQIGGFVVQKKNVELLYYLLEKSRQLGGTFVVDDKVLEAKERVDKKALEFELGAAIYGKSSPLADDDFLRDVAAAWGVQHAYDKSPYILKEELEVVVKRGEGNKNVDKTSWGVKELLEQIDSGHDIVRRAIAQSALDKGIVEYNANSFYYCLKDTGDKLLLVPAEELNTRDKYFVKKATKDKEGIWKIVKKAIITPEMIDKWFKDKNYTWLADEEGLEKTMKVAEKQAKLKEIYS